MITTLAITNYRSLRNLVLPLKKLNIISGANGSGKSSVYRALRLLAETSRGGIVSSLAREGGLQSTLWAGPESFATSVLRGEYAVEGTLRKKPVTLRLGFSGERFGYAMDLGLPGNPAGNPSAFALDPEIKRECIWNAPLFRRASLLVDRANSCVRIRGDDGEWRVVTSRLGSFDSMMNRLADPRNAPEILELREQIHSWRFYDHFRSDAEAPARRPQIGTYTPVLSDDGADLAAALQTIIEIGEADLLEAAVEDAFPGSRLEIGNFSGRFEIGMRQHGLLRPLSAAELSDGTLRYLLCVAALLTPRPPQLLVLNEPETSLHPDLLPALARLIGQAARHCQIVVVSHAGRLIAALDRETDCRSIVLEKVFGETRIANDETIDIPVWHWPNR